MPSFRRNHMKKPSAGDSEAAADGYSQHNQGNPMQVLFLRFDALVVFPRNRHGLVLGDSAHFRLGLGRNQNLGKVFAAA